MEIKKRHWVLLVMFFTFFITRSFISLQSKNFSDDQSYYVMRQVEHIAEHGKPIYQDDLSYSGRTFVIMPFYYYMMAFFYKIIPSMMFLKIVNNFLASTLIIGFYLLCVKILKNRSVSLFTSVVASSLPFYLNKTINNLNQYSLVTPLAFFIIWMFLEIDKKILNYLIPATIIFILSSFDSILLVMGILSQIIYNYLENKKIEKLNIEYASFFLLFYIWVNFIIYKDAFQTHGFSIFFFNNSITLNTLNYLGVAIILFGLYAVFNYSSGKKSIYMTFFISLLVTNSLMIFLNLVPLNTLIFIGMYLVIMMGQTLKDINIYLSKTKISNLSKYIMILLYVIIVVIQVLPGFFLYERGFSERYIEGFEWLRKNTPENSTILSVPEEGHLISYISKRKNVVDSESLLVDYNKRKSKILGMYTEKFRTNILDTLDEYSADYIILSDKLNKYDIRIQDTIFFADPCFELVYNGEIKVFKKCEV